MTVTLNEKGHEANGAIRTFHRGNRGTRRTSISSFCAFGVFCGESSHTRKLFLKPEH
jgi:hypothetical protein